MTATIELVKLTMAERQRDADRSRLAGMARRIAECCNPVGLRTRIARAIASAGDTCCPSELERLARSAAFLNRC